MGDVKEEMDRGRSYSDNVEAADPTPTTVAKTGGRDIKLLLEAAGPVLINNVEE